MCWRAPYRSSASRRGHPAAAGAAATSASARRPAPSLFPGGSSAGAPAERNRRSGRWSTSCRSCAASTARGVRLPCRQRDPHRLRIAHLADDDARPAPGGPRRAAPSESPARPCRSPPARSRSCWLRVFVFDRIFDGDDVLRLTALIALTSAASVVVLPEPVAPPTSTRPVVQPGKQFGAAAADRDSKRRRLAGSAPDRRRGAPSFPMQVHPEPADSLPPAAASATHHSGSAGRCGGSSGRTVVFDVLPVERRIRQRGDLAIDANRRRKAGDKKQIGRAARRQLAQPAFEHVGAAHTGVSV